MLQRSAFLLGFAGLIPAFVALGLVLGGPPEWQGAAFRAGALYAGLILSFLGGAWWGLATRAKAAKAWPLYGLAVIPTLAALALLMLLTPGWLVVLGGLIVLTLPVDRLLVKSGLAPADWMRLRVPLSVGLGLATVGLGVAGMV